MAPLAGSAFAREGSTWLPRPMPMPVVNPSSSAWRRLPGPESARPSAAGRVARRARKATLGAWGIVASEDPKEVHAARTWRIFGM
eukprot:scaffold7381_cov310-Pinguiococcus_pyrenoidosus.AAC.139